MFIKILKTVSEKLDKSYQKLPHKNISSHPITIVSRYHFVPNCRGESNKMHQRENYQDFLKWWGGLFLSHSLITIK